MHDCGAMKMIKQKQIICDDGSMRLPELAGTYLKGEAAMTRFIVLNE
jgi:hypothetical protein